MITLLQGINFAQAFLGGALLLLVYLHLHWGLRFDPQQERTALKLFMLMTGFWVVNRSLSGSMATVSNLTEIDTVLPPGAYLYFASKVAQLVSVVLTVWWTLFRFWPTQEKAP